jgi:hypothetical protein
MLPTLLDVARKAREVAAREPEKVYRIPSSSRVCAYWDDGCPSCLFGYVFHELGIPSSVAVNWSHTINNMLYLLAKRGFIEGFIPGEHRVILGWMRLVQLRQDYGDTWARCIEYADLEYPGVAK